jgi:Arc/MetJ family transcription regulator
LQPCAALGIIQVNRTSDKMILAFIGIYVYIYGNTCVYLEKIMRTNIVIDDRLMQHALEISGLRTKKAVVEEALKLLIQMKTQASIRKLRGKLQWEGDLEQMRTDR